MAYGVEEAEPFSLMPVSTCRGSFVFLEGIETMGEEGEARNITPV